LCTGKICEKEERFRPSNISFFTVSQFRRRRGKDRRKKKKEKRRAPDQIAQLHILSHTARFREKRKERREGRGKRTPSTERKKSNSFWRSIPYFLSEKGEKAARKGGRRDRSDPIESQYRTKLEPLALSREKGRKKKKKKKRGGEKGRWEKKSVLRTRAGADPAAPIPFSLQALPAGNPKEKKRKKEAGGKGKNKRGGTEIATGRVNPMLPNCEVLTAVLGGGKREENEKGGRKKGNLEKEKKKADVFPR